TRGAAGAAGTAGSASASATGSGAAGSAGGAAPSTASATSTTSAPSADPNTSSADSSAPAAAGDSYCAVLSDFETELTQVDNTPASVAKLKTTMEQMKQATPTEIGPDVTEAATVVGRIADGADAQTQTQDPAFMTAVGNISTWQSAHCASGSQ
ncbi:hypothetical protein, partial [Catenulispora rubra]|uniref:hypothetical protein n=1 Tax=Catenulispora rubra TaxID=280293 RepID=UPI0018926D3E